jgi:hypothetical protein
MDHVSIPLALVRTMLANERHTNYGQPAVGGNFAVIARRVNGNAHFSANVRRINDR